MVQLESETSLERGDRAPAFDLPGTDGDSYSLDDFREDDALLIVFTCNHCPYAIAKIEALNAIAADYDTVSVVGINPNDDEEYPDDSFARMREEVDAGNVRYDAYLRDESQDIARAYDAVCTPDPFLFENADDGFRLVYHGRLDDAMNPEDEPTDGPGAEVRAIIDDVLAGEPVDAEFKASRGCSIKWK